MQLGGGLGEWTGLLLGLMRLVAVVESAEGSDFAFGDGLLLRDLIRGVEVVRCV